MEEELHPVVKLARDTVEDYVRSGKILSAPQQLTPEMRGRAGVFVSIHKLGELRGCIGTFEPSRNNVAEEIISNAISSATRDPRFPPISVSELDDLEYSVDILTSLSQSGIKASSTLKDMGLLSKADSGEGFYCLI